MSKPLLVGLTFSYDWGFISSPPRRRTAIPSTYSSSHDAATYPGFVLSCKLIGILEVEQTKKGKKEQNDRVFAVSDRRAPTSLRRHGPNVKRSASSGWGFKQSMCRPQFYRAAADGFFCMCFIMQWAWGDAMEIIAKADWGAS